MNLNNEIDLLKNAINEVVDSKHCIDNCEDYTEIKNVLLELFFNNVVLLQLLKEKNDKV